MRKAKRILLSVLPNPHSWNLSENILIGEINIAATKTETKASHSNSIVNPYRSHRAATESNNIADAGVGSPSNSSFWVVSILNFASRKADNNATANGK